MQAASWAVAVPVVEMAATVAAEQTSAAAEAGTVAQRLAKVLAVETHVPVSSPWHSLRCAGAPVASPQPI